MLSLNSRIVILAALSGIAGLRADQIVQNPYAGITLITRTETSPRPETIHIAEIDLTAPGIGFQLTPPGGSLETVRQTTLDYLNQQHAQLAINGEFFLPFPSSDPNAMLIGLAASNGNIYSSFEAPVQSYAIVTNAPAVNIDSSNHAGIVHNDAAFADGKHVLENVTLWNALAGSAQIVTNGVKTIPAYVDATHPDGLLTPGGPANYSNSNSWYDLTNARTAIGLSQNNQTLFLFTVDNAGGSKGMTVGEVADLLIQDYGVYNALNLDGGGSTSMAIQDPATGLGQFVNLSSDNPNGRAEGSNLAVFAISVPEPLSLGYLAAGLLFILITNKKSAIRQYRAQRTAHVK
jgi:exopolysaccharide biosynthesis protein